MVHWFDPTVGEEPEHYSAPGGTPSLSRLALESIRPWLPFWPGLDRCRPEFETLFGVRYERALADPGADRDRPTPRRRIERMVAGCMDDLRPYARLLEHH